MIQKYSSWLSAIVISGVAIIAFTAGTLYGKGFSNLSWETIFAGVLGLVGGSFAYAATKVQITAQRKMRDEDLRRIEKQTNSLFYSEAAAVGTVCQILAETAAKVLKNVPVSCSQIAATNVAISSIDIPTPPITITDDVASTIIAMKVTKSRIAAYLTSLEYDLEREIIDKDKPLKNKSTLALLDDIHAYGSFLREQTQIERENLWEKDDTAST
ncbi:hypothetical protein [Thalassospira marina]|uniref:hypothetical protein n=1 Tax=Thalassospira marina TaxID=2048283 RepID=UPI0012FF4F77|nr:hypothetical protein [Thalassospira marina]